jgi:Cft2 family RNA processing exonuclease
MSPTNTNQRFQLIITGSIAPDPAEPNKLLLTGADNFQFRAAPLNGQMSLPSLACQWRVIPLTSTTGEISKLQIVDRIDDDYLQEDGCNLVGKIIQIAKKVRRVTVEIDRGTDKNPLKLVLSNAPTEMAVGEVWQIEASIQAGKIEIVSGIPLESLPASPPMATPAPETGPASEKPVAAVKDDYFTRTLAELTPVAQAALVQSTKLADWRLGKPRIRDRVWEWDAFASNPQPQPGAGVVRARVSVHAATEVAQVHLFERTTTIDPELVAQYGDRLNVTPLGAARSIGASCFQVEIGPYEVILDAGTRPKGSQPLPDFDRINNPNLILITHAHQDHIGALPVFHRRFGSTPMICTVGTREIAEIMLTDCLKVQEINEDFEPLFDRVDLESTLFQLQTQTIGEDFYPLPGLKVRFINAGHIVGAVCIYLEYGDRSLLYTGDYNTTSSRTTDGLKLADLPTADILITESTYGTGVHPSRRSQETELLQAVAEVVRSGGNVLIPAFALGRAQEIILAIRTSALFHSLNIPVYVDGLVRPVTNVFQDNLNFLPKAVKNFVKTGGRDAFFDSRSVPTVTSIESPRQRPLALAHPSVIIASSGMMTGGASVYYGKVLLERENAAIFISGYTDEESPGRLLQELEPGAEIELDGTKLTVRAQIRKFNLSAHADRVGLTQVIHRVNPRHLVLIHGAPSSLQELAKAGDLREKYWIHIPKVGDTITFNQPPEHLTASQLTRIDAPQEFEIDVEAEFDGAWLRVPESVLEDPRWQRLTATGTMTAQWSKSGLVLKPTTYKVAAIDLSVLGDRECCATCTAFDGRNCRNVESPLFGKDVDPMAKCQEYTRTEAIDDLEL